MLSRRLFLGGAAMMLAAPPLMANTRQTIFVNMRSAELRFDGLVTPVVLPKPTAFQEMSNTSGGRALGAVSEVNRHPTWVPTPNTRRAKPSLPPSIAYGQPGHPLGKYRFRVRWDSPLTSRSPWPYCYLHGGAKPADLGQNLSLGCVRIPDAVVVAMAERMDRSNLPRVQYDW